MSPTVRRPCPRCLVALISSPAAYCSGCARERDKQRGSPSARGLGYDYQAKRERILRRDGYRCWRCGEAAGTVDHFIPRSRGGTNDDSNLRAACAHCNSGRRP